MMILIHKNNKIIIKMGKIIMSKIMILIHQVYKIKINNKI